MKSIFTVALAVSYFCLFDAFIRCDSRQNFETSVV